MADVERVDSMPADHGGAADVEMTAPPGASSVASPATAEAPPAVADVPAEPAPAAAAPAPAPAPGSYAALRAAARGQPVAASASQNPPSASQPAAGTTAAAGAAGSDELGAPAMHNAAQQSLEATRVRAAQLKERGLVAAQQAQQQAEAAAEQGQAAAQETANQAGQMAVAAADVARANFEERWRDVMAQEQQLSGEREQLEVYERQLHSFLRQGEPNFPPQCCCIDPIVYHNITGEVFPQRIPFVKAAWTNWIITCVLLVYNFAIAITMMFIGNKDDQDTPADMESHLVASVIMLFGTVLSFILWYWPVYKACSSRSAGQHVMSYVGIVVAIVFNIVVTLGPVGFGGCGIMYGFAMRDAKGTDTFYPCLVNAIAFAIQCGFFMFMFYRMKCKYGPEDKATFAKAQAEMAKSGIMGR